MSPPILCRRFAHLIACCFALSFVFLPLCAQAQLSGTFGNFSYNNFYVTSNYATSGSFPSQHGFYVPMDANATWFGGTYGPVIRVGGINDTGDVYGIWMNCTSGQDQGSMTVTTVLVADITGPAYATAHVEVQGNYGLNQFSEHTYNAQMTGLCSSDAFNFSHTLPGTGDWSPIWGPDTPSWTPVHRVDVSLDENGHGTLYWGAADSVCSLLGAINSSGGGYPGGGYSQSYARGISQIILHGWRINNIY